MATIKIESRPLSDCDRKEIEWFLSPDKDYGLRYRFNHEYIEKLLAAEEYWRKRVEELDLIPKLASLKTCAHSPGWVCNNCIKSLLRTHEEVLTHGRRD